MSTATLPSLLHSFFTERLLAQRRASSHTVASYRDCFRLLLGFATKHLGRQPSALALEELDAALISNFLDHLERERGNSVRSRNVRLAALHSFFRYVAMNEPAHLLHCQRVLAIPNKRYERKPVGFLDEDDVAALLKMPDLTTWIGRRDRALLLVAVQTGLRVSELIGLRHEDISFGTGAHVRCLGKGRKHRATPLRKDAVVVLKSWMAENEGALSSSPLFPSSRGGPLSRDAVEALLKRHLASACEQRPSLKAKRATPHTLRHSMAMSLLQHGVDRSVIALWLGHESVETTQIYLHADMRLKERALAHASPSGAAPARFRPKDDLLAFLQSL
jgi:site-specific recombinase XerD